jgi:hypothetical protein
MTIVFFLLMTLLAIAVQGQTLKLDIHVLDDKNAYLMSNIQVKEVDSTGTEVIKTFTMKKGRMVCPLELGKKYVLHFWAPDKEFRSVIVDCTDKGLDMNRTYTFAFDITLPDELPPQIVTKDLVAMIWFAYDKVQYTKL